MYHRITEVFTSKDKVFWERDAAYDYYRHGPLARTILGQQQVQGVDYAYTLQGWLKGINSLAALPNSNACEEGTALDDMVVYDRGQNGAPSSYTARNSITFEPGFESNSNDAFETVINGSAGACDIISETLTAKDMGEDGALTARDAYGITLHYYDAGSVHDYVPVGATQPLTSIMPAGFDFASLYNGNIGAMSVNVPQLGIPLLYGYRYDQLNRLKTMQAYKGLNAQTNSWEPVSMEDYKEQFSYSPDGSIETLMRNGSGSTVIDNATWHYYPGTHRLKYINDPAGSHGFDAGTQGANNYSYNEIGEMTGDVERGVTDIRWNVYGKVTQQQLSGSRTIHYTYDAGGNRISKQVTGTGAYTEWYVRDATGNVLSIYRKTDSLRQTEQYKYGSSLLGVKHHTVSMEADEPLLTDTRIFTAGEDEYYLSDHRGNTMVTVKDTRKQHDDNSDGIVDYYTANIITAQDYSSFGALLEGRQFGTTPRFTYNGKQLDKETGWQHYGMREYLGGEVSIFASVDPLTFIYSFYTPYQFAGNNPIKFIDLDGAEPRQPGKKVGEIQNGTNGDGPERSWKWDGNEWIENSLPEVIIQGKRKETKSNPKFSAYSEVRELIRYRSESKIRNIDRTLNTSKSLDVIDIDMLEGNRSLHYGVKNIMKGMNIAFDIWDVGTGLHEYATKGSDADIFSRLPGIGSFFSISNDMINENERMIVNSSLQLGYRDFLQMLTHSSAGRRSGLTGVYVSSDVLKGVVKQGFLDLKSPEIASIGSVSKDGYDLRSSSGNKFDYFLVFPISKSTTVTQFIPLIIE